MELKEIACLIISADSTILEGLKQMDQVSHKLLIVQINDKYEGLLSIGDIQRAVIKNIALKSPIRGIMRHDYITAKPDDSVQVIKELMLNIRAEFMPVIDFDGKIKKVYFWEDFFSESKLAPAAQFNLPVVIMAGGIGSRLRPLTSVLPKALLPIREKTMLEEIFDRFELYGCKKFYVTINYKADLIRYYVKTLALPFEVNFIEEPKPMGTAGSLSLLKGKVDKTFFVTNCDILVEDDYSMILKYHEEQKNEITIVAAMKHLPVTYGVIETGSSGQLTSFIEKPELTLKINTGMYILEPHLIDEIPSFRATDLTDLIRKLKEAGRTIGVFPISQSSWVDIGEWSEYLKTAH